MGTGSCSARMHPRAMARRRRRYMRRADSALLHGERPTPDTVVVENNTARPYLFTARPPEQSRYVEVTFSRIDRHSSENPVVNPSVNNSAARSFNRLDREWKSPLGRRCECNVEIA